MPAQYRYARPGQGDNWFVNAGSDQEAIKLVLERAEDAIEIRSPDGRVIWTPYPPKRLFDEKDRYTDDTRQLDQEAQQALRPVLAKWLLTHSARDVEYVVQHLVTDLVLGHLLGERLS